MLLGVNIDHIAVLREARRINDPDPVDALSVCKRAGADQITFHLREDRRHIHDYDARRIVELSALPTNMECATDEAMIAIACELRPHRVTLVPEKREEVTTEGGLDVSTHQARLAHAIQRLTDAGIEVSLFIDPDEQSVIVAHELGVRWVEFHTGGYANIDAMLYGGLDRSHHRIDALALDRHTLASMRNAELAKIRSVSNQAAALGLRVAAGHGLNYRNVGDIALIETIEELNIGQSIVARAVFTGLERAITDMKRLIAASRAV